MIRALTICLLLSGCNGAKLQSGDYADALTTVHVVASPKYVEIGTAPDQLGPVGAAVGVLVQKYIVKAVMIEAGVEPELANNSINSLSWYWACQNLALFAGVEPVGRVATGLICAAVSYQHTKE